MKFRAKARRLAHNNREYILFSRLEAGDCTFCPRHDGENTRGEHSKWGKKRAIRRWYTSGKGRKAPKTYRVGYTYKNYGIDIIPGSSRMCRIYDKGYWCEWEPFVEYYNPNWVYPTKYPKK